MKYTINKEDSLQWNNKTLYRIIAGEDFGDDVKEGDEGGYLHGKLGKNSWVYPTGKAIFNSFKCDNVKVYGEIQGKFKVKAGNTITVNQGASLTCNRLMMKNSDLVIETGSTVTFDKVLINQSNMACTDNCTLNIKDYQFNMFQGSLNVDITLGSSIGLASEVEGTYLLHGVEDDKLRVGCLVFSKEQWLERIAGRVDAKYFTSDDEYNKCINAVLEHFNVEE